MNRSGYRTPGRPLRLGYSFVLGCWLLAGTMSAEAAQPTLESILESAKKTFGLGVGAAPQYEGADEYRPVPFIIARLRWGARYFVGTEGSGIRADVVGLRFVEAGPALSYRFPRDEDVSDEVIARLPTVGGALEVGGYLALNFPCPVGSNRKDALTLAGNCLPDVSGGHDGFTCRVGLLYRGLVTDRWVLRTGPFATYGSDRFMAAYYSVAEPDAMASGLNPFHAGSGFKDVGYRVNTRYRITPHWNVNLTLSYRRFIGDAARSPIIADRGSRDAWFGGMAFGYSW